MSNSNALNRMTTQQVNAFATYEYALEVAEEIVRLKLGKTGNAEVDLQLLVSIANTVYKDM